MGKHRTFKSRAPRKPRYPEAFLVRTVWGDEEEFLVLQNGEDMHVLPLEEGQSSKIRSFLRLDEGKKKRPIVGLYAVGLLSSSWGSGSPRLLLADEDGEELPLEISEEQASRFLHFVGDMGLESPSRDSAEERAERREEKREERREERREEKKPTRAPVKEEPVQAEKKADVVELEPGDSSNRELLEMLGVEPL